MAIKRRKGKRKRQAAPRSASSSAPASSSSSSSSIGAILPDGAELEAPVGNGPDGADAQGAGVPPLPPDDGEPGAADPGAEASGHGSSSSSSAADAAERARLERVAVLRMIFAGAAIAIPAEFGGGELSEPEANALAESWELPLRPYWDSMMGPWTGALLTTAAIFGPRVLAARARVAAQGVDPGQRVG